MQQDNEKILEKITQYFSILKKVLSNSEMQAIEKTLAERLSVCPRGLTKELGGYPGGLVDFSFQVAIIGKKLANQFNVNPKSIVKVALLHELGKVGGLSEDEELYLEQESDWHREKLGQYYKYNPNCPKMNIGHRTLWMLNELGIKLTRDEFVSVLTSQGLHLQENSFYGNAMPPLASLLQSARGLVLSSQKA
jgi:hypothetical protein